MVAVIGLIARQIKKISLHKINICQKPDSYSKNKIKFESDLSNYAKKSDLKMTTNINASEVI